MGEVDNFESRSLCSDGSIVPVSVRISSIQFDGEPALLLHVRDITERRNEEQRQQEQERQLAHVSRLTMMGQLVAGIAHEIRQPLWSISTLADVCQEALGKTDAIENLVKIREYTNKLVVEARRVNQITTRMFTFARKGQPERVKANIEELIQDSMALAHHRAKSNRIVTSITVDENCPEIQCDRVLIEQTIVNLLNNAYSAVSQKEPESREVNIFAKLVDESICVSVVDNGTGLPEGVTPEQLFEGFFTTTRTGMGIGLALSRSFVEDHGGRIWAESNATGGMTFQFTLRIDGGVE
jgi:two-component system sensor kinase FixL